MASVTITVEVDTGDSDADFDNASMLLQTLVRVADNVTEFMPSNTSVSSSITP